MCTRRVAPSSGSFFSKSAYCAGYDSTAREGMAKTPPTLNFQAVYDHTRPQNSGPSRSGPSVIQTQRKIGPTIILVGVCFTSPIYSLLEVLFTITAISKFVTKPQIFLQQEITIEISSKNCDTVSLTSLARLPRSELVGAFQIYQAQLLLLPAAFTA